MKETKNIEFKETISNTFLKTVSAFANYSGGKIIFGITDDGKPAPISNLKQTCLDIENTINDSISPQIDFFINQNKTEGTITLEIKEGPYKPYLYKSKAYKRNDTSTVEVDAQEFTRLVLQGKNINYESLPSDNQKLSFSYFTKKCKEILNIEKINIDILKTFSLFSEKNGYNKASELLSDNNTFPGIDIARFGENLSIIKNRKTLESISVLEQFEKSITIFKDYYEYEEIKGASRNLIQSIPEAAFREALANAIIHRIWDINSKIRIMMFDDKIQIISPGGLPFGISETEYLNGRITVLRNPILANVFFRLNIVEIFGTGILRIKELYKGSIRKPGVTLPIFEKEIGLTKDDLIVYNSLSKTIEKSISEIIEKIPFGKSKTTEILNRLVEKGYACILGNGRGTKYLIKG